MKMLCRRVLVAALSLTAAAGGLLVAGTAQAQAVSTGTLSFSGPSGEYISQGKSYSYSISNGDGLTVSSANGGMVSVSVNAYNGDWWTLDIDAPGSAVLAPGTYTAAHRYPFNGTGPGLDLSGNGRGCNTLTGSFTITKAVFGAQGYVQNFDATFEENCEGGTLAVRGEVHISNPPAPPAPPAPTPRRTATSSPRAAATSPHATPSSTPSAAASSTPSTAASSGNTAANATGAGNSAKPATATRAFRPSLLLTVVGLVAWVLLNGVSLAAVGIVMAVRRR